MAHGSERLGSSPRRVGCLSSELCFKLFKSPECAVLSMAMSTIKNHQSVECSLDFGLPFCRNSATIVEQKAT